MQRFSVDFDLLHLVGAGLPWYPTHGRSLFGFLLVPLFFPSNDLFSQPVDEILLAHVDRLDHPTPSPIFWPLQTYQYDPLLLVSARDYQDPDDPCLLYAGLSGLFSPLFRQLSVRV